MGRVVHPTPNPSFKHVPENAATSDNIGVIVNPDETIQILIPAKGFTVQEGLDLSGETGTEIDRTTLPADNVFRDAWRFNTSNNKIYVDAERAKEIVIDMLKKKALKDIAATQEAFNEAFDMDDMAALGMVKVDRQDIRNRLAVDIANVNACVSVVCLGNYLP
jgi:hypothetical protein